MSDSQQVFLDEVPLQQTQYVSTQGTNQNFYRKEASSNTSAVNGGGNYWYGLYFCLGIVAIIVVILIISSVGLGRSTNNQNTLNTYIAEWHEMMEERNSHAEMSSRMIALNNDARLSQRSFFLCTGTLTFHRDGTASNATFKALGTETIEEMKGTQLKSHLYYHVTAHLMLVISEGDKKKEKTQLTVLYNISSTLVPPFSSVRLEEMEYNTHDHSIGALRTIILCSNNPDLNVQSCEESITKRKIFVLHGEDTVPLAIVPLPPNKIKQETTVDLSEEPEALRSLRMYNIVFYIAKAGVTQSEDRILTVVPLQC